MIFLPSNVLLAQKKGKFCLRGGPSSTLSGIFHTLFTGPLGTRGLTLPPDGRIMARPIHDAVMRKLIAGEPGQSRRLRVNG
jgi:hypothetical protein